MISQFKKGVLEMAILFTISEQDTYGYELMKEIKLHFPDTYEGTIYTVLRRLVQDKHVVTYDGKTSEGPKRKYFKITENGTMYLQDIINQWQTLCHGVRGLGIK
jgi:PadR family transcriptional regulator PadR